MSLHPPFHLHLLCFGCKQHVLLCMSGFKGLQHRWHQNECIAEVHCRYEKLLGMSCYAHMAAMLHWHHVTTPCQHAAAVVGQRLKL